MKMPQIALERPPLREALAALFADPREKAFFFVLDGVLACGFDIDAGSPPDVPVALLAELERAAGGAVAVLADVPLVEADRMLAPLRLAGCGLGGREIRPRGAPSRALREVSAAPDFLYRPLGTGASAAVRSAGIEDTAPVIVTGASLGHAVCRIMDGNCFAGRIPIVFGPAEGTSDCLAAAQFFGGTAVAVGAAVHRDADILLDGPRDVQWIIRDFLAHLEAETGFVR